MSDLPSHEAATLPVQLPGKLVGREAALTQVYGQLKEGKAAHVYGVPGVGKTALAATLAGAYAQQPGGVLWLNVENDTFESLITRVGRAYSIDQIMTGDNPLAHVGAAAATLTQNKPLIVLDGSISAETASRFVSRLAERLPVIIANREPLDGPWASVELTTLAPDAALALFKQEGAIGPADTSNDNDLRQLVRLLNHLPFAIGIAARALLVSKQTPAAYTQLLQQVNAPDINQSVLTLSFSTLNGALQGLVLIMGASFRGQASPELLSMVSGAPVESVQQAMKLLNPLKLVEQFQRLDAPYFRLHPVIYAFARARLTASNRLDDLQIKFRDALLAYARKYGVDNDDAYDKLEIELDNLGAAARWSAAQGDRDNANQLVILFSQAGDFVGERGYVYDLLQLRQIGTASSTAFPAYPQDAPRAPEAVDIAALLADEDDDDLDYDDEADDLLRAEADDDDDAELAPEDAITAAPDTSLTGLRASLAQARQQGDISRQIEVLRAIARLQLGEDHDNEAIATYNELLTAQESTGDNAAMLETLEMLSALMVKTENSQAAVLHATRGVKLAETLGDAETLLQMHITLGDARQQLGESEDAERVYEKALEIARRTDDKQHEAIILYKLGYAQLDNNSANNAIDTWEQALKLFRTQEKREYEGKTLGGLGTAYGELERWAEAISFHTSALHIAREVADEEEEALHLSNLGYASKQAGQLGQALLRYRQALHLAYESNDRKSIVNSIVDLVNLLAQSSAHLSIAELLIDDALRFEANDKDVRQLKERIVTQRNAATANGVTLKPVNGTAQQYAANAYKLLEE